MPERATAGLQVTRRELGQRLLSLYSPRQACAFAGVFSKVENCEIRVILTEKNSVRLICFLHLVSLVLKSIRCSRCLQVALQASHGFRAAVVQEIDKLSTYPKVSDLTSRAFSLHYIVAERV